MAIDLMGKNKDMIGIEFNMNQLIYYDHLMDGYMYILIYVF
jgi:hypothetical protein